MGIGSVALKALKLIPRYAFSNGVGTISKARKATVAKGTKSIFGKDNEFALKNARTKISAGWDALKKDAQKTMNSKKGVWTSLVSFGKSLISKPKAGIKAVEMAAAKLGKTATFWQKAGGALKGLGKACKKLPIVGTLFVIGGEIPDIYDAFSRGGAWEGTKQVLKSSAKIVGFAAGTALGTVIGGPVGGLLGGLAGDMLINYVLGGSYSENHPKPEDETEEEQETSSQETDTSTQGTSAQDTSSDETESSSSSSSSSSEASSSGTTDTSSSTSVSSNPYTGVTNPLGTGLTMPTMGLGVNPFGTVNIGINNPFGSMGYVDPTQAWVNSILQPGENIFQKYPMGFRFQYVG